MKKENISLNKIIAASAIIFRDSDNLVFAAQRSKNKRSLPGLWETIGGGIENNETPEECIKREIKEELNSEINFLEYFNDYPINDKFSRTFLIKLTDEPTPNAEDFDDWGWFDEEQIQKKDFALNCKERILDYLEYQKSNSK